MNTVAHLIFICALLVFQTITRSAKHLHVVRGALLLIVSSRLLVPVPSIAAEEVIELDKVVVTATRTERNISDVPASVSVVTAEDIENASVQSVDEVLQEVVGADIRHPIGVLSTSTSNKVVLRGLGGKTEARTLLLIDGVPANDLSVGAIEWNQIPLEDIERIEIVRGAASALYGSNAMGGVINIITKKPSKKTQTKLTLGYGSMDTKDGLASISGSAGRWGYRLLGGMLRSDGYETLPEEERKPTSIPQGVERENVNGMLSCDLTGTSSLNVSGTHFHEQKTGTLDYAGFNPNEQEENAITTDYRNELGSGGRISANLYAKWNKSSYDSADWKTGYTSTSYTSSAEQDTVGGSLQVSWPIGGAGTGGHVLTAGLDFRDGNLERFNDYLDGSGRDIRIKGSQRYAGLYAQDEIFLMHDALILNIGGRYDYWENDDGYGYDDAATPVETNYEDVTSQAFSPKLGAIYRLTSSTSVRGAVGKAFRAPTLNDLYSTFVWGTSVWAGNPNLDPETVLSYEIGLNQKLGESADLAITLYRNDAKDFIGFITPDPVGNPRYREKQNIGEVSTQGLELEYRHLVSKRWNLSANYTYNKSTIEKYAADPSIEGNLLPEVPEHKGGLSIIFTEPTLFTAKVSGRYVGERYNDDANETKYKSYTLVDLHISKDLGKIFHLSLDVNDLFDKAYTEYYVSPGRTVMAKLTASF